MSDNLARVHAKLRKIRERKDLSLRPTKHLRETFTDFDGNEKPLKIRYYQVQGILHLVAMLRFVLGDDTGLGKTLETIAALCFIWEKKPNTKVVVLTKKSAVPQWVSEFAKFSEGARVIVCKGSPADRRRARTQFEASKGPAVIVMGYRSAVQDFRAIQGWEKFIFVTDEATAYKNPKTQVAKVCAHLSQQAARTWALTATLIKNNLIEGYGIYNVVVPGLFGSLNHFMLYFCLVRMQRLPRSNRQIPIIVGYSPEKIAEFRDKIDPYYIGRHKHEVASELPALILRTLECGMTPLQEEKYADALSGLLEVGEGVDAEQKEVTKLTAITYCQQIVNHPKLIGCEGTSEKLDLLLEILTEGEFAEENVIVFTRFKKMVDLIMPVLAKKKISAIRITGDEDEDEREEGKAAFNNPKQAHRVAVITTAGSDAINLQSAKALICFDTPFSAGDFIQLIGRMIRIGSLHDFCYVIHLLARRKKTGVIVGSTSVKQQAGRTVDHRVMEISGKKMKLVEAVIGKRLKGIEDNTVIPVENDISDLFSSLQDDAREDQADSLF